MYFSTQWRAGRGAAGPGRLDAPRTQLPVQPDVAAAAPRMARPTAVAVAACCSLFAFAHEAGAAPSAQREIHEQGVLGDFRLLAQMRPRRCAAEELPLPVAGWQEGEMRCAWQGRLMVRSWTSAPLAAGDCVSPAALWWRWAHARYTGARLPSAAWERAWPTQQLANGSDAVRRIAIIARTADDRWLVREWRWHPSERAATRRWQEGRWQLLAQGVQRLAQGVSLPGTADGRALRSLRSAWEQVLGPVAGEVVGEQWRWPAPGGCLVIDSVGVARGSFQLPYLVEDSRLEQRAAMQLQLARRQPGAVWLQPFSLVDAARQSKQGLARYKAVWREQQWVRGQLWIPTRDDGPVLRLRMSMSAPANGAAAGAAAATIERELERMSSVVGQIDD